MTYDYDWVVVGSGFGGSVSALRLAEKGYSVAVIECGKRFEDKDFPKSTWDLRRYFWAPRLGMRGIFRLTVFKDVFVASGNGEPGPYEAPGARRDPIEATTYRESRAFAARLRSLRIPLRTDFYGAGVHDWPYWQRELHRSLPLLLRAIHA